jgi:hypothetical protein
MGDLNKEVVMKPISKILIFSVILVALLVPIYRPAMALSTAQPAAAAGNVGAPIMKYLILLGSGGPVACGDSLYALPTGASRSGDLEKDIKTALTSLFANRSKTIGGLYNPLYQSRIKVEKVVYKGGNQAAVYLKGQFVKPKDACDRKRFREVVFRTAQQFPEARHVIIFMNRVLLGDLLESK